MRARDDFRLASEARRAVQHGRVWVFEGRLTTADAIRRDAGVRQLVQHDRLRPETYSSSAGSVTTVESGTGTSHTFGVKGVRVALAAALCAIAWVARITAI